MYTTHPITVLRYKLIKNLVPPTETIIALFIFQFRTTYYSDYNWIQYSHKTLVEYIEICLREHWQISIFLKTRFAWNNIQYTEMLGIVEQIKISQKHKPIFVLFGWCFKIIRTKYCRKNHEFEICKCVEIYDYTLTAGEI